MNVHEADVLAMAHAIQALSVIEPTGLMRMMCAEDYAKAARLPEDDSDALVDEAIAMLVKEGEVFEEGCDVYDANTRETYEASFEDSAQAEFDERQAYHISIWG